MLDKMNFTCVQTKPRGGYRIARILLSFWRACALASRFRYVSAGSQNTQSGTQDTSRESRLLNNIIHFLPLSRFSYRVSPSMRTQIQII